MKKLRTTLLATITAACALVATPALSAAGPTAAPSPIGASPYLYNGWASPPNPVEVMNATGIRDFTLAFVLSDGTCNPAWDGTRPLQGGVDAATIDAIRAAGGDVIPSIGGYNGAKLGEVCPDATSLAGAYQEVIDAYGFNSIDIDIEATEFTDPAAQDRVLEALRIVEANNPGLRTVVTFPTLISGPNQAGVRMIQRAAELGTDVDVWTQMPFNFGGTDMAADTITATEALKDLLKSTFGYSDAEAYARTGISSMNGRTDTGEIVRPADFQRMADYATANGLGRFTFWSANRDRPCSGDPSACSGIDQQPWEFTRIVAAFAG
ncbi:chitinase [Saccharopolyspora sp. CA-218241]|uniref:chitinase n=1 Tax=Saccharopolyspora sp. CA-218241 TaxID=3240027 RepID=UPI003D984051